MAGRLRPARTCPPINARNLLRYGGMRPDPDWLQFGTESYRGRVLAFGGFADSIRVEGGRAPL